MKTMTSLALGTVLFLTPAASAQDGMEGGVAAPPATKAPAPAPAPTEDVLVLKAGGEVRGRITAEDENGYAVKVGGSLRVVEKSTVSEVRRGEPAAPGSPAAESPTEPRAGKDAKEGKDKARRKDKAPAPLSDEGRAWAKTCIERILGSDPAVQKSAAEALRALGPAALPLVREAREAADDAGKQRLDRVAGLFKGEAPPARPNAGILERVRTELALDDAASRTVGTALLEYGRKAREVVDDARDGLITYEDARTKGAELRSTLRSGLASTLSEEQLAKLDVILDEAARRMGGGGPKKDAPAPKKEEPAKPVDAK